jgi:hypothetical protein
VTQSRRSSNRLRFSLYYVYPRIDETYQPVKTSGTTKANLRKLRDAKPRVLASFATFERRQGAKDRRASSSFTSTGTSHAILQSAIDSKLSAALFTR